jgi:hypothetical protein
VLGITLATIRVLCENRVVAAETTPGGHWRVPSSEVERLKRDGLPPIPRPMERAANGYSKAAQAFHVAATLQRYEFVRAHS